MILLVNELFEGHYLIHKHQPHIETYMWDVTSLHSILVGEQLLNRQFPAISKTVMRKKRDGCTYSIIFYSLLHWSYH